MVRVWIVLCHFSDFIRILPKNPFFGKVNSVNFFHSDHYFLNVLLARLALVLVEAVTHRTIGTNQKDTSLAVWTFGFQFDEGPLDGRLAGKNKA